MISDVFQLNREPTVTLLDLLSRLAPRLKQAVSDVSVLGLLADTLRGPVSQVSDALTEMCLQLSSSSFSRIYSETRWNIAYVIQVIRDEIYLCWGGVA